MNFRIGRIPVQVRPAFLVVAVLLSGGRLNEPLPILTWAVVVFVSVLIHELGHAAAFTRFGHSPSIDLYAMGGLTRGTPSIRNTPGQQVVIALAGPFAGFCVGGLTLVAARVIGDAGPLVQRIVFDMVWVNFGWGAINLLPIWPLDGSQAFAAVLRAFMPERAMTVVMGVSTLVAGVSAAAGFYVGAYWAAVLAGWFGVGSFRQLRRIFARGADARLDRKIDEGHALLGEERIHEARACADEVLAAATNKHVVNDAIHLLAWVHLRAEEPEAALHALGDLPVGMDPEPALLGQALLRIEGRESEAVEPLTKAFYASPSEQLGRELVMAFTHRDDLEAAVALIASPPGVKLGDAGHAQVESTLFFAGQFDDALEVSRLRYERFKVADAAYNAACSAARLRQVDTSMSWLKRAFDAGYHDADHLEHDEDLAPLRGTDEFRTLLDRMRA